MAKYSIQDTTLTAIGDAIRNKTGEHTRLETETYIATIPEVIVSKTPNATGFETYEGEYPKGDLFDVVYFPGASSIYVDLATDTLYPTGTEYIKIAPGKYDINNFPLDTTEKIYNPDKTSVKPLRTQFTFDNTDVITILFHAYVEYNCLGYYAECKAFDADGNPMGEYQVELEREIEVPNTLTPAQMATEIEGLNTIPAEALVLTGDCNYRLANNGWNLFVNTFEDKITTKDITNASYMFYNTSILQNIPFDLCFKSSSSYHSLGRLFYGCYNLVTIPKIVGAIPDDTSYIFSSCRNLVELSEEAVADIDWSYVESRTSSYGASRNNTFENCYRLRKFPMSFLAHVNPVGNQSSSIYYNGFYYCYSLDELINIPILYRQASWTSNAFYNTFGYCNRLKDIIFETNEDGSPIKIDTWTKQAIDLSSYVGYFIKYNTAITTCGFTTDTRVTDDTSYQALKDNPDWWSNDLNYSRYNHDSAVRTINSLPDLSAKGGNTITFKGESGSLTDGGAINTLTEEEIAVAAAKGWTVTFK